MAERYQHTQIGYVTLIALGATALLIGYLMTVSGFNWIAFAVLIVLGVGLVLFATLTVVIEGDGLEMRFGPGVIRRKFSLKDVESCRAVKNPWYYGWGIRLIPGGWLYNVSGLDAVELKMKNGRKYRIGTDVPYDLEEAIRQSIERMAR